MIKLKTKEIPVIRDKLLISQYGLCALCHERINGNDVLDHNHFSGVVRGVLHRGCNAFEGIIQNSLARNEITQNRLETILANIQSYQLQETQWIHPAYKTAEEKAARAKKRAKAARDKKKLKDKKK